MLEQIILIWEWLKKLSPEFIRVLCIALVLWIIGNYTISGVKDIFKEHTKSEEVLKKQREQYTVDITPNVNSKIKDIMSKDTLATNVILLNYHNTLLSSHGLSYKYLTSICEQFKGMETKPCSEFWKELDYMNYGEEIHKINNNSYMLIYNNYETQKTFPKFAYLLERSGFKAAAFYPLQGVNGAVGMIVIGYPDEPTKVSVDYVRTVIAPNIQPLSTLLDYDYVNEN